MNLRAIACPHCGQTGLRLVAALRSRAERPACCGACGKRSYQDEWVTGICSILFAVALCGGIVLALHMQSAWLFPACLALPVAYLLLSIYTVPLAPYTRPWPTARPL